MTFSKSFPKTTDKSVYPRWVEIFLTEEEEKLVDENTRHEHAKLMKECIEDAKDVVKDKNLKKFQSYVIQMAIALFEKRASHVVWKKEALCKDKFDKLQK